MTDSTKTVERAAYETPVLVAHGTVHELTQGTAGQVPDTAQASQPLP